MGCSSSANKEVLDCNTHVVDSTSGRLEFTKSASYRDLELQQKLDDVFWGFEIPFQEILMEDAIGSGSFGDVFRARYQGAIVAVKKIFLPEDEDDKIDCVNEFNKEIRIMSQLCHPCIIRLLGACSTHPNYCIVTELMAGSVPGLLQLAEKRQVMLTWNLIINMVLGAARGMEYLHGLSPRIVHRDLKAENLLIDSKFKVKIADFGLSRPHTGGSKVMTVCGTPCWVAPEMLRGDSYNEKVDIYSFAICMWELFSLKRPHHSIDPIELPFLILATGLRPRLPIHCPPELTILMEECWTDNPNSRPSFTDIINRLEASKLSVPLDSAMDTTKPYRKWSQRSTAPTIISRESSESQV